METQSNAISLPPPSPSGSVQTSTASRSKAKRGEGEIFVSPQPLLATLAGFAASQVLMTAHELGVFSALAEGPQSAETICAALSVPLASGARLLSACAAFGLLIKEGETYANTPVSSAYLMPESPMYLGGLLRYYHSAVYGAYGRLKEAVVQNAPQVESGGGRADILTLAAHSESAGMSFLQAMHSLALWEGRELAKLFDFSTVESVLDVGGGSGAMALALAQAHPHLSVRVFDRPAICRMARKLPGIGPVGTPPQVEWVEGDFWTDPIPTGSQAILLSSVLHDWDFDRCEQILARCREALSTGGVVLLFEQVLNEDRLGPLPAVFADMTMLLRTAGGQERTEADYRRFLQNSGFSDVRVKQGSCLRRLIWARREM